MKKNIILLSFSTLLCASPGILGQPTDKFIVSSNILLKPASTPETNTPLLLAKANTHSIEQNTELSASKKSSIAIKTNIAPQTSRQVNNEQQTEQITTVVDKNSLKKTETAAHISDEQLAQLRQQFLQAEIALKNHNEADYFLLSDKLKDYPLYPYLQYQWLRKNLGRKQQIIHFLQQHSSSRYAAKLKHKWLNYLGKRKQWSLLLENRVTTKNVTLNCYFHRAEYNSGEKDSALLGAQKLWAAGHSQPRACDPLFTQLQKSSYFTQDLRWKRFAAALRNNKVSLASYVRDLMPTQYQTRAQLWIDLHRKPSRYLPQLLKRPESAQSAAMLRHAINRLASKDITKAIETWDANKQLFATKQTAESTLAIEKLEHRLALKLVFEREPDAYERLENLDKQNNSSRTWRVRIALVEQNWPNVLKAIYALSNEEKTQEKWQYWLARAYIETGKIEMAQPLLTELANKRSFYGFLASDKVNTMYQLSANPINVTTEEISALKNQREFRVAFEFMVLDRKNDAKLQWWHAVRQLSKKEIIVAAKLAQQWQWDEIAIFTIAKAKHWDDIELRFPLTYADKILENSLKQKLNPAILFGLVRRESAFNQNAYSPVGARGLMQIMPGTGRVIARNLKERWRGSKSLYNPETNLKYGAFYYQKLLKQFDGNYAIALAAYNAGPHRVKKWLPKTQAMPADIWIETIPYKETREYVTNVLAYALIYQQRALLADSSEHRPIISNASVDTLSMNDLTRDVQPRPTKN